MEEDEIPDIDLKKISEESKREMMDERELNIGKNMEKIKHKIVIISGKGGVGKSTVAVNIAVVLAQSGARVGLLDADIYGPNVPIMMGVKQMPEPENEKLVPAEAYGIKIILVLIDGCILQHEMHVI